MLSVGRTYDAKDSAVALCALYKHFLDRLDHHSKSGSVVIVGDIQYHADFDAERKLMMDTIKADVYVEPELPKSADFAVREYKQLNEAWHVDPHKATPLDVKEEIDKEIAELIDEGVDDE